MTNIVVSNVHVRRERASCGCTLRFLSVESMRQQRPRDIFFFYSFFFILMRVFPSRRFNATGAEVCFDDDDYNGDVVCVGKAQVKREC